MSYAKYLPYVCNANPLGTITRKFGSGHSGVDSVTAPGKVWDVCAVCDAVVDKVYWSDTLGNVVQYSYNSVDGTVTFAYYHLRSTAAEAGQAIKLGTKVGVMGNTGSASRGVHLHVSMWIDGVLTDPEPYLAGKKTLPAVGQKGGDLMIRKVTAKVGLWLRKSAPSGEKIVLMPVDTVLICGATKTINGATWSQAVATVGGKEYAGWCCITGYTAEV